MSSRARATACALLALVAAGAAAQSSSWGRISIYALGGRRSDGGNDLSQVTSTIVLRSPRESLLELVLDARLATYPSGRRADRVSLYDAYVGATTRDGRWGVRVGQMWLPELASLGGVGGLAAEYRSSQASPLGHLRLGAFAGLEPKLFEAGLVSDVRKAGAYVAADGAAGRRHVLGFVTVRNRSLTERSVLTLSNFVPVANRFWLYQAAEYDLQGPGGTGDGGLNYVFANARWAVTGRAELQGSYHHGRSIDARTITEDQLAGRPVDARALQGYLFESTGARVTVRPWRHGRVWAGYARERDNRGDDSYGRTTVGLWAGNLAGRFDFSASGSRVDRATNPYTSWYASLGASLGRGSYVTLDYSTSLAVLRYRGADGVEVETRPETRRIAMAAATPLGRSLGLQLTLERFELEEGYEDRVLIGLTVRF